MIAKTLAQLIAEATGKAAADTKTARASPIATPGAGGVATPSPPAPTQPVTVATANPEQGVAEKGAAGAQGAPAGTVHTLSPPVATRPQTFKQRASAAREKQFAQLYVMLSFNATAAYQKLYPRCTAASACELGLRWLQKVGVAREVNRLLRSIEVRTEAGAEYVTRHIVSMAESNAFDYLVPITREVEQTVGRGKNAKTVTRKVKTYAFQTDRKKLTREQQLNVRGIKLDDAGNVVEFKMPSRERAIDMLAKANRMYGLNSEIESLSNLAASINEAMERSAKLRGRTFDHESGEVVDDAATG